MKISFEISWIVFEDFKWLKNFVFLEFLKWMLIIGENIIYNLNQDVLKDLNWLKDLFKYLKDE